MKRGKHIPKKLFIGYLMGSLTEEQLMQHAEWREEEKEQLRFLKQQLDKSKCAKPISVNAAWEKEKKRCKPMPYKPPMERFVAPRWRYAAAASLLLAVTLSLSLIFFQKENNNEVFDNQALKDNKPLAYLELSDGQIVDLTKKDTQIIDEHGVSIQLSPQTIFYDQKDKNNADLRLNTLKVPSKGDYKITLSDGTVAWLNSESELIFPVSFGNGDRRISLKGEAYFEVAKQNNSRFIIETKRGDIEVMGTSFNISSYDDDKLWHVTLVEGVVNVTTSVNGVVEKVKLRPSQQLVYDGNSAPEVRTVNTNLYTSWREGVFAFEDMPLNEIAMRLERWYGIKIAFKDSLSGIERYTGVFRKNENIDMVTQTILNANKVTLQQEGNQLNIWAKSNMH